jgi:hypothetical protein
MFTSRMHAARIAFVFATAVLASQAMAADSGSAIPDLSGQWGRDMLFFEPPPSGPGPIINLDHNADGTLVPRSACCGINNPWAGDHANPILKPEAAEAVRAFASLALSGAVAPELHNTCRSEPPPFVMALHFGVLIVQARDHVTLIYLLQNTVRHVPLNVPHPANLTPSWQGH